MERDRDGGDTKTGCERTKLDVKRRDVVREKCVWGGALVPIHRRVQYTVVVYLLRTCKQIILLDYKSHLIGCRTCGNC